MGDDQGRRAKDDLVPDAGVEPATFGLQSGNHRVRARKQQAQIIFNQLLAALAIFISTATPITRPTIHSVFDTITARS
jgi:hypothetical protein